MDDDSELLDAASSSDEQAAPTASSSLTEEARRRKLATPLWGFIVIYVATALVQPTLTDKIRYVGGAGHIGWPPTLLATITNTLAMASLMIFADGGVRRALCRERASLRRILIATAFDFTSGCLLTTGLLMLGGGIWVVIYSSTTVWTALFACCTGQRLAPGRWAGVLLVSGGMVLSASGNFADAAGDVTATVSLALGCASTLAGTMLHAAMFVYSELSIKQAGIDMFVLCAGMGFIETVSERLIGRGSSAAAHRPWLIGRGLSAVGRGSSAAAYRPRLIRRGLSAAAYRPRPLACGSQVVLVCWNLGLFAVWGPSLYMPEEQVGIEHAYTHMHT